MLYVPRKQYIPFHERSQRWACIVAHRRNGKTVACVNDMINAGLSTKKHKAVYSYIAPYRNQAKTIAWEYMKSYTDGMRLSDPNETELSVRLARTGATLRLFGADNDQAMRGMYNDGAILDEFGDMRPRTWGEIIRPTLADRNGWAVFIGTPKGHNGFYDIHQIAQTMPDWYSLVLRASETGIIKESELEDLRLNSGMTEDQYLQEFECSFEAAVQGAFYGREMNLAEKEGRITSVDYDPDEPVHTAWDLGWTDDTAILFYQFIAGEVRIIDGESHSGRDIPFYVGLLRSKPYKYGQHWLPHDAKPATLAAQGKSILQQLWELGVKGYITPRLDRIDGIQAARKLLPRCWFDRGRCKEVTESLKLYQREWDDDKKVFKQTPRHDWTSHYCLKGDSIIDLRRGPVAIKDVIVGDEVWTPAGYAVVEASGPVKQTENLLKIETSTGLGLVCTPEHKIFTSRGLVTADALRYSDQILTGEESLCETILSYSKAENIGFREATGALTIGGPEGHAIYIGRSGKMRVALFQKVTTFITKTATALTTPLKTLSAFMAQSIRAGTCESGMLLEGSSLPPTSAGNALPNGTGQKRAASGTRSTVKPAGMTVSGISKNALSVVESSKPRIHKEPNFVISIAKWQPSEGEEGSQLVYDLTVRKHHCYRANGLLCSNSDAFRYLAVAIRDRVPQAAPPKPKPVFPSQLSIGKIIEWSDAQARHRKKRLVSG